MKIGIRILLLWLGLSFCTVLSGQVLGEEYDGEYFPEAEMDTMVIRDTVRIYISRLEDVTRTFGMTFDAFVKEFLRQKKQREPYPEISPECVYLNYFLPMRQGQKDFQQKRFISHVFTFYPDKPVSPEALPLSDSVDVKQLDILFTCGGELLTDYLITSGHLKDRALVELFRYIDGFNSQAENTAKIRGINFYFPEYRFREKRAMAQFAKSASLILDSTHLQSIRNLSLYFSFDKTCGLENRAYLSSLSGMADSIFLLENNGINPDRILTRKEAGRVSFVSKIANQFYLARFFTGKFPVSESVVFSDGEIKALAEADYPDNNWEDYLFALIGLCILLPILLILYWILPEFAYYLTKNRDYLILLILMFVLEIILLLLAMIEAMSKEDILNLSGNNRNILLLLPLLLVFAMPLFKAMGDKGGKP